MGSHSGTCHPAEVRITPIPPDEAGTRFSDPKGMQGWVDLHVCYVKADRLGIESATCKSQVKRPTAKPPRSDGCRTITRPNISRTSCCTLFFASFTPLFTSPYITGRGGVVVSNALEWYKSNDFFRQSRTLLRHCCRCFLATMSNEFFVKFCPFDKVETSWTCGLPTTAPGDDK